MADCEEIAQSCTRGGSDWTLGKVSIIRVVKHCNKLPEQVVDASCLSVVKRCLDNVLRNMLYLLVGPEVVRRLHLKQHTESLTDRYHLLKKWVLGVPNLVCWACW